MKLLKWTILLSLVFIFACGDKKESETKESQTSGNVSEMIEPDHIEVQHLLVSFKGAPRMTNIERSKEEAKTLAYELFERAKKGEDFDELVKKHTNDSHPGKYKMANSGIEPDKSKREFSRKGMVAAFGNVGFKLKIGEIGIADHDATTSPFGWHIIKRIK